MKKNKLAALLLAAAVTAVSMGIPSFAASTAKVEAEADGVSVCAIPNSMGGNSKVIKDSEGVTFYINPGQYPRATVSELSQIKAGETAAVSINFSQLFSSGDSAVLEYCLFISKDKISLDSTLQSDARTELLNHVSESDIVSRTILNGTPLLWDLEPVKAEEDGYVYLYIGCGNLTEDGKVADFKRQWKIDSFDVNIYEEGEEIPPVTTPEPQESESPAPSQGPTTPPEPTPTLAPTSSPEPIEGFTVDGVYSDNMVFQRGEEITITGTGKSGDTISVSFNGETVQTVIEHNVWEVTLPAMGVVKSSDMTITNGTESVTLKNVAVGDVILCSGQSNMDLTFNSWGGLRETEPVEDYENMRLFTADSEDGWKIATTDNAKNFSALGYMIGKRVLLENPDVPVGLVKSSLGGSGIVQWVPSYAANWSSQAKRMMAGSNKKGDLYTKKILPVKNFKYSAAVWYQGEANTSFDKGTEYETMLISLINNWRTVLEDEDLPFVIIQLPTANFAKIYGSTRIGTGVRAAQWNVSERMDNVDTVVSIDTGSTNNVHPSDKQPIADRAAAFIRDYINGTESDIKSPSFDYMERNGDTLILHFKNTYGALMTDDGEAPLGFELKGADGTYSEATPVINGDTLEFDVSGIENPQVKYAWNDAPGIDKQLVIDQVDTAAAVNTVNAASRPMAPFKTDETEKYAFKDLSQQTDCYEYSPYVLKTEQDGDDVVIKTYDVDGVIEKVDVYVDEAFAGNALKQGDEWRFTPDVEEGVHTVYAIATDNDGHINTECVDYPNYNLVRPARYDFVKGDYSVSENLTEYNNGDEIIGSGETNADGQDLVAEASVPYGETTPSAKLEVTSPNKTVNMTVPVSDAKNAQKKITIEYDTKFERQDDEVRAARGVYAVTKTGEELHLIYFTKTSMRAAVYGRYYETSIDMKSDMWHHIKMEIYPNAGTFSLWLDDVMKFDNVSFINEGSGFETNKAGFDVLKEGITALKFYHTSAKDNNNIKNTTYVDNVVFEEEAFVTEELTDNYEIETVAVGDSITVGVNITQAEENAVLYIAQYDENGNIVKLSPISDIQKTNTAAKSENTVSASAFIWNDNMKPLCGSVKSAE